jgi:hypothetical protein
LLDATLATRTTKIDIDQDALDQAWRDDGATINLGTDDIDQLVNAARPTSAPPALRLDTKIAIPPVHSASTPRTHRGRLNRRVRHDRRRCFA